MIRRYSIRRLAAFLGLLAVGLFFLPRSVLAHSLLQAAEPRSGAVVKQAPTWVRLQFSEPVEAPFTPLMVYDSAGSRVDKRDAQVDPGDPTAVIVGLQPVPDGFYTVSYRVTSADGHPIEGAYGFSVGEKAAEGRPIIQQKGPELLPVVGLVRGVVAWASVALVGLALFWVLIWRPLLPTAHDRRFQGALLLLAGGLLVTGIMEVGLYAVRASGEAFSLGLLLQGFLRTRVGLLLLLRMGLALLVGLVIPGLVAWTGTQDGGAIRRWLTPALAGLLGGGLLLTLSLNSHAAAVEGWLPLVADGLHLVAAALWLGGIFGFVLTLPGLAVPNKVALLPRVVRRFSLVATGSILLLAGTGLYTALLHVDGWDELVKTDWGSALLVKLGLLVPLLLLGLINLRRGGRREFHHIVVGELLLISALFVAVGYLTSVPPANVAVVVAGPYQQSQTVDGLQVELRIEPFQFGYNDAVVLVQKPDGTKVEGANVGLRLMMLEMEMGRQDPDAKEEASGQYRAPQILLGMPGRWRVEVVVLTKEGQEVRVPFELKVPKQLAQ
jgi:copper transport protein